MKNTQLEMKDMNTLLSPKPATQLALPLKHSNISLLYAALACLCYGICNFIIGFFTSKVGIASFYPMFLSWIPCWLVYHAIEAYKLKRTSGKLWLSERSYYIDQTTKKISLIRLIDPVYRGAFMVLINYGLFYQ